MAAVVGAAAAAAAAVAVGAEYETGSGREEVAAVVCHSGVRAQTAAHTCAPA